MYILQNKSNSIKDDDTSIHKHILQNIPLKLKECTYKFVPLQNIGP